MRSEPLLTALRLGLTLICACGLALGATAGSVHIAPSLLVLALGCLALVALAPWSRHWSTALPAALIAGAMAGHLLFQPGMPRVHDLMHLWGIAAYGRCVSEGSWFPLWIPYLGLGQPLLQFYGPINFLLALPGILLGLSPMGTFKLELLIGHGLAPLATLIAARLFGCGWRGATVAGIAVALAPWRLAVFGYRGALGEANAFLFMPLLVAGALGAARGSGTRHSVWIVLGGLGLLLTHAVSLATTLLLLAPALIVQEAISPRPERWRRSRRLGVTLAITAILGAVWWLPVAVEAPTTSLRLSTADNPYYRYSEQGLSPTEPFRRKLWDRVRVALPSTLRAARNQEGQQMPFYIGTVLFVAGCSAPWWSRRRETWPLAAGAALAVVSSTSALAGWSAELPGFAQLRFPWRFLSPGAVFAALAVGIGIGALQSERRRWVAGLATAALCLALVWDAAPYTGAPDRIPPYEGTVHWYTEDRDWVYWEESMRPVQVDLAPTAGVTRVRNLELPPADFATPIDGFFPAYYEWFTPETYSRYWKARDVPSMIEAGVAYGFSNLRPRPVSWRAQPYVTVEGAEPTVSIDPAQFKRGVGRIDVDLPAPVRGRLVVREQAFPGWRMRLDRGDWVAAQTTRGFLSADLGTGAERVEFAYGWTTTARRAGLLTSLLGLVALLVWAVRSRAGA